MKRLTSLLLGSLGAILVAAVLSPSPSGEEGALDGKAIFLAQKCNMCHAVPAAGIEAKVTSEKMKGPDIDGPLSVDAAQMAKYLRKQAQLQGKDHKKEFKGSDEELTALIEWMGRQKKE